MNPFAALAVVASSFAFLLAGLTLVWHPRAPLNRWVAVWFAVYGLEALLEAVVLTAGDPSTFWWSYRASRVLLAWLEPLSVQVTVTVAGIGKKGRLIAVGPLVAGALVQSLLTASGNGVVTDYQTGPWGNHGVVDPGSPWIGLRVALGAYTAAANLVSLLAAWIRHPAPAYRHFLLGYLTLVGAASIAAAGSLVLWNSLPFPDLVFVLGVVIIVGLSWLLARHPFLSDHRPSVDLPLVHALKTALFVLDGRGRVLHASQGAVELLGRAEATMERKSLAELLGDWPGLADLDAVGHLGRLPTQPLAGAVGPNRFRITLTPSLDRFGQVRALYARLDPVDLLDRLGLQFGVSPREKEVAALLAEGMTTQQIADLLFISVATVKNHLHRLFEKTGTSNRVELVRLLSERR